MKESKTLRKGSKSLAFHLKSGRGSQDMVYYGNDCVTKYWAGPCSGHIPSPYDALAEQLKQQARNKKRKAIGE